MRQSVRKKKWSASEVELRHARATRLRIARKAGKPAVARIGELSVVREVVDDELLRDEPRLVATRWLTYSFMSALQCTELFCELYLKTWRSHFGKVRDHATADQQIPVNTQLFLNDERQINGLWRARQESDRIGMPYELFLNAVIGGAANQKNRKYFPAPNQLYDEAALKMAQEKWEMSRGTLNIFGDDWDDRLFFGDEKAGLPRLKAMRLVFQRVSQSKNPDITLANYLGRCGAIDEVLARRMFHRRPGLVDDALRHVTPPTKVRMLVEPRAYAPSCLGIIFDIPEPACSSCPVAQVCEQLWLRTSDELKKVTGSTDPRKTRKQEMAAERQRRCRQRKRERTMANNLDAA